MDFLEGITWDSVSDIQSVSNPSFTITDYFEVVRQPADGNCFYHSLAELYIPNKSDHAYRLVKNELREAAEKYFPTEPEAAATGMRLDEYLDTALRDNEWGGSLEAAMLSRHLGLTVVIWLVDGSNRVVGATRFGKGSLKTALHLLHSGLTHFDALRLLATEEDPQQETMSGSHHHHHH
uniref:Replicase n=1 Tax=Orthonairovirus hazaraense TaxID=3052519 RepID=UPI00186589F6|nr:Chain A, Replicase [Orthonairovirus hazaraense]7JMS_C Chain C, Replicase [Orthonairovirus hazaraense]7JMS_E Chain E, Replicase [Orthonairovirus hazaraense]7JMS_G Chain G, Replicase [Orthonairovirus hazaraense]